MEKNLKRRDKTHKNTKSINIFVGERAGNKK